jgi:hypothetical protein
MSLLAMWLGLPPSGKTAKGEQIANRPAKRAKISTRREKDETPYGSHGGGRRLAQRSLESLVRPQSEKADKAKEDEKRGTSVTVTLSPSPQFSPLPPSIATKIDCGTSHDAAAVDTKAAQPRSDQTPSATRREKSTVDSPLHTVCPSASASGKRSTEKETEDSQHTPQQTPDAVVRADAVTEQMDMKKTSHSGSHSGSHSIAIAPDLHENTSETEMETRRAQPNNVHKPMDAEPVTATDAVQSDGGAEAEAEVSQQTQLPEQERNVDTPAVDDDDGDYEAMRRRNIEENNRSEPASNPVTYQDRPCATPGVSSLVPT